MGQFSATQKQNVAFFNALNKMLTEGAQYPFESKYRSLPNIPGSTVWTDVVPFCQLVADADTFVLTNPTIGKKYSQVSLTPIPGSNNQAWYLDDAGTFVTHWIAPTDVPHPITNDPSDGFQASLYTSANALVPPTSGKWNIFYAQGIVLFEAGSTPIDMGWGVPKITCYSYVGGMGVGAAGVIDDLVKSVSKTWSSEKIGNALGTLETFLDIVSLVPANTVLNVAQLSNAYFNRTGDIPNIGGNISQFNRAGLRVYRNSVMLQKGVSVFYDTSLTIHVSMDLRPGEQLYIVS